MTRFTNLDFVNLPSEPAAIAAMVKGVRFREAIERVPADHWSVSLEEAERLAKPSAVDRELRESLWQAIRGATASLETIKPSALHAGVCSAPYWYRRLRDPRKVAWYLLRPQSDQERVRSIVPLALRRFREILELDIRGEDGQPNEVLVKTVFAAIELVMKYQLAGISELTATFNR